MTYPPDPRLDAAKLSPITEVIDLLRVEGLRRSGRELTGPCPRCGGTDRFNINTDSMKFLCRQCGIKGGDQVGLVMALLDMEFRPALHWLCGPAQEISPAEIARRRKAREAADRKQADEAQAYRERAIRDARAIWTRATPQVQIASALGNYLASRGLPPARFPDGLPDSIRFLADHPYVRKIGPDLVTLYRGPCMIARIDTASADCMAVHQTWLENHGLCKAVIRHEGQDYPAKMVRGAAKGGVIRLSDPRLDAGSLIMGEGIETTLTAMLAAPVANAACWAGVSLGNMAGKMRGVAGVKWSGLPLMEDRDAFVPPAWVRRLIFVEDGDSSPRMTRAKMLSGLRRAMAHRPGLKAQIVRAGEGIDLNDLVRPGGQEEGVAFSGASDDAPARHRAPSDEGTLE